MHEVNGHRYSDIASMQARVRWYADRIKRNVGDEEQNKSEMQALKWAIQDAPPEPPAKPFYAYYRTASGGKGIARFATRKGLDGFVMRTPHAVTAHN